ncbi:MAG: hypothetical protein ACE5GL_05555, partial [Calditrichia bacterium]
CYFYPSAGVAGCDETVQIELNFGTIGLWNRNGISRDNFFDCLVLSHSSIFGINTTSAGCEIYVILRSPEPLFLFPS